MKRLSFAFLGLPVVLTGMLAGFGSAVMLPSPKPVNSESNNDVEQVEERLQTLESTLLASRLGRLPPGEVCPYAHYPHRVS